MAVCWLSARTCNLLASSLAFPGACHPEPDRALARGNLKVDRRDMEPQTIDVVNASREISSAYDCRPTRPPFFFIVGSGISYPSVPLADEITTHCRQKAEARGITRTETTPSNDQSDYSFWFDKAYPQPVDRQRYLRGLIENKAITAANLRLAHILLSRKISNLVVTPNFDDFLARSLEIFGERHIVSDDPRTVDRIDLDGADIQIVHVHGSYRFYDCRNLREELVSRARPSLTSSNTMAAFMDRALAFRSPIVVGYSGREDDVIMAALRRGLEGNALRTEPSLLSNQPFRVCFLKGWAILLFALS
jgi:hypothetical protein